STHTSGFRNFTCHDLTDEIPAILRHWESEGIQFDAIYTGYLANQNQIAQVLKIWEICGTPDCGLIVDPAMADHGALYPAFDARHVSAMKELCFHADVILPNLTEACLLTDTPYTENYNPDLIADILQQLKTLGAKSIILTGISYEESSTGVVITETAPNPEKIQYYQHQRIAQRCHGTGDIYTSVFTGAYLRGMNVYDAARIAADFTVSCIEKTKEDSSHWYGVKFELVLPELIQKINFNK
ncbi:MAG: bifunctional hydroxymethylpyrimidine kinase/phosphomethylpyrimidine kinase, partial [Oscillospiraceae bacterium]|nr:bifunctional hydroxymethylpyrimidine kinase/phosphomethylpyrimidine kinase [Oscillospiraceae bacterium]